MKHISIKNFLLSKVGPVLLVLVLFFGLGAPMYAALADESQEESMSAETLIMLTNEERINKNLLLLEKSDLLQKAAELKADDMVTNGYFSHTGPDGKFPGYWFKTVGYRYKVAGENLAVNFFDSEEAMRAWMRSPEHRENILYKDYTETGIAVREGVYKGKQTLFVVQFFGTPLTSYSFLFAQNYF